MKELFESIQTYHRLDIPTKYIDNIYNKKLVISHRHTLLFKDIYIILLNNNILLENTIG